MGLEDRGGTSRTIPSPQTGWSAAATNSPRATHFNGEMGDTLIALLAARAGVGKEARFDGMTPLLRHPQSLTTLTDDGSPGRLYSTPDSDPVDFGSKPAASWLVGKRYGRLMLALRAHRRTRAAVRRIH